MQERAGLHGRTIAVPETRLLDVLASLIEKRGGAVVRCPLVSIHDTEDQASVVGWLERFIAEQPDLLILYTGEGVNRLIAAAERAELAARFKEALASVRTLTRGPKPARALRALGLSPTVEAPAPTTDGIIAALSSLPLEGSKVAVQMYGSEPNAQLLEYLAARSAAVDWVAPYAYASAADDAEVVALIERLQDGAIDAITFTSKSQVERLRNLAARRGLEDALEQGLQQTRVAAVGPVVAAELETAGIRVDAMPPESFHMKPLVIALEALFTQ